MQALLISLLLSSFLSHPANGIRRKGFSIPLTHRDKLFSKNITFAEQFLMDKHRLRYHNLSFDDDDDDDKGFPIFLWREKLMSVFLADVSIGSNLDHRNLFFDTGSSLSLVSCDPNDIYRTQPPYNPYDSATDEIIGCDHPNCSSSCDPHDTEKKCPFFKFYLDRSIAAGFLVKDTITVEGVSLPDFIFGCATKYNIHPEIPQAHGILGLQYSMFSPMSQLDAPLFSVCVPPPNSDFAKTYAYFGEMAKLVGNSTPLVEPITKYNIGLESVKIGEVDILSSSSNEYLPMVVDTGASFTLIPSRIYQRLSEIINTEIELPKVEDDGTEAKYCYYGTMEDVDHITISLRFLGSLTLDLSSKQIFRRRNSDRDMICFVIRDVEFEDRGMLGMDTLANFNVAFDLIRDVIHFAPMDCNSNS